MALCYRFAMVEPSRRSSRQLLAAATLGGLALAAGGFALGRSTAETAQEAPPPRPLPTPSPSPTSALPIVPPPLGRAELIGLSAQAADAAAAGQPMPPQLAGLVGRAFELRIPFGCPGEAQAEAAALSWSYDEEEQALRVRAEPARLPPEGRVPVPDPEAEPEVEAIEGFWIARPWTSSEACLPPSPAQSSGPTPSSTPPPGKEPAKEPANESAIPTEETLAIVQLFGPESSRLGRRDGQAYQAVESVAPEALDVSQGLRLRLRGRLTQAPGGGPVLCRAQPRTRPECLIVVTFNEVAIENPALGETIATWDVSSQGRGARR